MKKIVKPILMAVCMSFAVVSADATSPDDIVGKIDDEFTVTPMGQVNYEIPIPALPGTGGLTPKLSVTYSSSTKSALVGYGFDLTGLSIISRVPRNKFNDGVSGHVDFTSSDKFSLDGARLIQTTSYGTTIREFSTEQNSYSKIMSYGAAENPDSFIVRTKDGLKYNYLPNIKILDPASSTYSLFWMLTRVTDTKGNYFTVTYTGDNQCHEIYPSRIDYTGNESASLQPYASVRFTYESSPDSLNFYTYVYGEAVKRSKCIQQIGLYSGETLMKRFNFTYNIVNHKKQLSEVTEYADDNTAMEPTSFQWYNVTNVSLPRKCYSQSTYIYKATLTIGDFNGDGKADFLATPENNDAGWTGWRMFHSIGDSLVYQASGNFGTDEIQQVVSGDFNGDGRDDVVVLLKHNNYYNSYLYLSTGNGFQSAGCKLTLNRKYYIHTVETNGDGLADLFAWVDGSDECKIVYSLSDSTPLGYTATRYCPIDWDEIEFGDFNGDGLTDVWNCNDNAAYVMFCDGYGTYTEQKSMGFGKKYDKHFGDFNGDGKTDILITSWNNMLWTYWQLYLSDGKGVLRQTILNNMADVRSKKLFVADINGDGFDDCIAIDKTNSSGNMVAPIIWLNDGTGYHFTANSNANIYPLDKWSAYFGDFSGDGKAGMLCTSKWVSGSTWRGFQLYQMSDAKNLLLSSITDGMGNTTEITYKYMSDSNVHTKGNTYEYPLSSFTASWPLVSQVKTPNGIGGRNTTTYRYENALIHRSGRGVLGFEKVIAKNETTNTTTTSQYEIERHKYVIGLVRSETKVGTRVVSKTETEYNDLSSYGSVFAYNPISKVEKTYEYTSGTLLSQISTTYEYDNWGNLTRMVSTIGDITTETVNTYSDDLSRWFLGRLTSSTVTKTSPSGSEVRHAAFAYDSSTGLMTGEGTETSNQALGFWKFYQRDAFGNITQSTVTPISNSSAERTETTTYDTKGRYVTGYTNSIGHSVINTIDQNRGLLTQSKDANNVITNYTYDSFGRQTGTSTPISQTTTTMGWSTGMTDAPSYAKYYVRTETTGEPYKLEFFDCLGRSIRTVTENALGSKIYVDIVYNSKGQVQKTSEPYFPGSTIQWNQNTYDAAGRLVSQTTAGGAVTNFSYYGYNTTTTDALNHHVVRRTDQYGNLVQTTDHNGGTINYQYDLNGHCTQIVGPRTTIRMEYNLMGYRTLLDDPDLGQVTSTYNTFGELVSQTDSQGTTTYTYDKLGRVTREQRPDVTINSVYDTNYKGALTSSSASNGTSVTYQYDAYGRIHTQTDVIGTKTYITQTSYNNLGKVNVITYPSGLTVKHEYASNGILNAVKNAATNAYFWQLTQQDARGNVTVETLGNGLVTTNTYNAATGYLVGISTPGIQNWTYQYNLAGNLTMRKDNAKNLTERFEYDALDRLVIVRKNGQTMQTMTYDAVGNILSKTGIGHDFVYQDGTNRLTAYDSDGYQAKCWDDIQYTSFHKISHVALGTKSLTLTYGPGKSRVKAVQTVGQSTTTKYYVSRLYEETYSGSNVRKVCYIFAAGKAVAIHETIGSTTSVRYLHHDHLGSIQAYSNEAGALVQELSYDAWGRRRNPTTWAYYNEISNASAWHERGFVGHEHLDLFEMVNMDGRMYDPVLGRFLSPDPYVQTPDFTQGLNRYSYCLNNPLSLIDPTGYSWLSDNWKSLVAAAVGIAVSVVSMGSATPVAVFLAGAAGGAAGALTGALLNGANIGQIAKATFTGAVIGGFSAVLNGAAGDGSFLEQLFKHTFSQGWLEGIQGGNVIHGFMMGAVSGIGGRYLHKYHDELGKTGKVIANAVLSGTVSEIGGGKFANGAITGAYSMLFNEFVHNISVDEENIQMIFQRALEINKDYYGEAEKFYLSLGGKFIELVNSGKYDMSNACAAKLSEALRLAGIEIESAGWKTVKGNKGYYYANAKLMSQYFSNHINVKGLPVGRNHSSIKYGLVYQSGFSNVSGHVDVVFSNKAAGTYYNPELRGSLFNAKETIVWRR